MFEGGCMVNPMDNDRLRDIGSELHQVNMKLNMEKIKPMLHEIIKSRYEGTTEEDCFQSLVRFAEQAGLDDVSQLWATTMILLAAHVDKIAHDRTEGR